MERVSVFSRPAQFVFSFSARPVACRTRLLCFCFSSAGPKNLKVAPLQSTCCEEDHFETCEPGRGEKRDPRLPVLDVFRLEADAKCPGRGRGSGTATTRTRQILTPAP